MADTKVTPTHQDFPEVKGKIVDLVEFDIEPSFYGITIRFQDKTSLTFSMESSVVTFPVLEDWTEGEGKIIKEYQPLSSYVESGSSPKAEAPDLNTGQ